MSEQANPESATSP